MKGRNAFIWLILVFALAAGYYANRALLKLIKPRDSAGRFFLYFFANFLLIVVMIVTVVAVIVSIFGH